MVRAKKPARRRQSRHAGQRSRPARGRRRPQMLFTKTNYVLMLQGILAIVIGYAIMRLENEVDGIISLYVAPLLILGGYLEIVYAILWRPKAVPITGKADN